MTDAPRRPTDADGNPAKVDGRFLRTERTRQRIIEAFLTLLQRGRDPTANEIADRAGCSVRSVFERFHDMMALRVAAADHALVDTCSGDPTSTDGADRQRRLRGHVTTHASLCERMVPLWRNLLLHQDGSETLRQYVVGIRAGTMARLERAYDVELATLPPEQRRQTLIAAEAIIDIDCWSHMRDFHGLSFEEACDVWLAALDKLLPQGARGMDASRIPPP